MIGVGALLGLLGGTGLYLIVTARVPWRARQFVMLVHAYLHPLPQRPGASLTRLVGEERLRGIALRQMRAGLRPDPSAHLLSVVLATAVGLSVSAALLAAMMTLGSVRQPAAALPLLAVCGASAWLIAERRLDGAARRRQRRAAIELPGVAESLALAVGAGAALPQAMELLTRHEQGVLVDEFARVLAEIHGGSNLDRALTSVQQRLPLASIGRFIDALRIALERGTPIVDVLHAQAADARNESRRLLLERAGRRELMMMAPVVFFVLPTIVLVALFPGFRELTAMAQ